MRVRAAPADTGFRARLEDAHLTALARAQGELEGEARLADARRPGDEDRPRHALGDAFVERSGQQRELLVATDERCALAHQGDGPLREVRLLQQKGARVAALDLKTGPEQPGRGLVENDAHAARMLLEGGRRAIDGDPDRHAARGVDAARRHRQRKVAAQQLQRQGAARGALGEIGGGPLARHQEQQAAPRQRHRLRAVALG